MKNEVVHARRVITLELVIENLPLNYVAAIRLELISQEMECNFASPR